MTKTQTLTVAPTEELSPPTPSYPDAIELSLKKPGRTLRELSRRIAHGTPSNTPTPRRVSSDAENNIRDDVEPPANAQPVIQRWNEPRANIARLGFAFFSFIVTGMNDGAVGV
jgi:hypothetical protein